MGNDVSAPDNHKEVSFEEEKKKDGEKEKEIESENEIGEFVSLQRMKIGEMFSSFEMLVELKKQTKEGERDAIRITSEMIHFLKDEFVKTHDYLIKIQRFCNRATKKSLDISQTVQTSCADILGVFQNSFFIPFNQKADSILSKLSKINNSVKKKIFQRKRKSFLEDYCLIFKNNDEILNLNSRNDKKTIKLQNFVNKEIVFRNLKKTKNLMGEKKEEKLKNVKTIQKMNVALLGNICDKKKERFLKMIQKFDVSNSFATFCNDQIELKNIIASKSESVSKISVFLNIFFENFSSKNEKRTLSEKVEKATTVKPLENLCFSQFFFFSSFFNQKFFFELISSQMDCDNFFFFCDNINNKHFSYENHKKNSKIYENFKKSLIFENSEKKKRVFVFHFFDNFHFFKNNEGKLDFDEKRKIFLQFFENHVLKKEHKIYKIEKKTKNFKNKEFTLFLERFFSIKIYHFFLFQKNNFFDQKMNFFSIEFIKNFLLRINIKKPLVQTVFDEQKKNLKMDSVIYENFEDYCVENFCDFFERMKKFSKTYSTFYDSFSIEKNFKNDFERKIIFSSKDFDTFLLQLNEKKMKKENFSHNFLKTILPKEERKEIQENADEKIDDEIINLGEKKISSSEEVVQKLKITKQNLELNDLIQEKNEFNKFVSDLRLQIEKKKVKNEKSQKMIEKHERMKNERGNDINFSSSNKEKSNIESQDEFIYN